MAETMDRAFSPDWTVAPGDTIIDLLDEKDMTQTDLARRLGVSLKHVNQLVNGSASISAGLALGLEKVLGPSAAFWMTRDGHHQAALARHRELEGFESKVAWARQFPIADLRREGLVSPDAKGPALVRELLGFFGLASPRQWIDPCVAFRKSQAFESDRYALSAWLRAGEREAATIRCEPYDRDRFVDALEQIRALTRLDPDEWQPRLEALCAAAGVAVVIVETFNKARANGATRWLSPTKALIQLSLRGRWEDIFWFTFFHEAAHVVLHRKKDVFIEGGGGSGGEPDAGEQQLEDEADRFAARLLVPPRYERRLMALRLTEVEDFAEHLGIAPAIVVGRMHHEGVLPYNQGNKLRKRFEFSS